MAVRLTRAAEAARRPHRLIIFPEEGELHEIDNGTLPRFGAKILDKNDQPIKPTIDGRYDIVVKVMEIVGPRRTAPLPGHYYLDITNAAEGKFVHLKGTPIKLDFEDCDERTLVIEFSLRNFPHIDEVSREVVVQKAQHPVKIRMFTKSEFDPDIDVEIVESIEWTAGAFIEDLRFEMYDENGKRVKKCNLSDTYMTISWRKESYVKKFNDEELNEGRLPRVRAPYHIDQENFYSIAYHDTTNSTANDASTIEFSFIVKARPAEAKKLALSFEYNNSKTMVGEVFKGALLVKVCDKFNNGLNLSEFELDELEIDCPKNPLEMNLIKKTFGEEPGMIRVEGLKFSKPLLGANFLALKFRSMTGNAMMELVPGYPKKLDWDLSLVHWERGQEIIAINSNQPIKMALQLYDEFDHKANFDGVPITLGLHRSLEMKPDYRKILTDDTGRANFDRVMIKLKDANEPTDCTANICDGLCYGIYTIRAKANLEDTDILSPNLKIHLTCDTDRPTKFVVGCLCDIGDDNTIVGRFTVGEKLPFFKVKLLAENGRDIRDLRKSDVVLLMCRLGPNGESEVNEIQATGYADYHWEFDISAGSKAGPHRIMFAYKVGKVILVESRTFKLQLYHGKPIQIFPSRPVQAYLVSNKHQRRIIDQVDINLYDVHENIVSYSVDDKDDNNGTADNNGMTSTTSRFDGTIKFEIVPVEEEITAIPKFANNNDTMELPLKGGKCRIDRIEVAEKSVGIDGKFYYLRAIPDVEGLELQPWKIKFLFKNDVEKEEQMNALLNEAQQILERHKRITSCKNAIIKNLDEMNKEKEVVKNKRKAMWAKWQQEQNPLVKIIKEYASSKEISATKEDYNKQLIEMLEQEKLRKEKYLSIKDKISKAPEEEEVIGKVAHMAQLEDPDDALLLSWHLQDSLDMIVTTTVTKALDLNMRFDYSQKVLALETIKRCGKMTWEAAMPHVVRIEKLTIHGNPISARRLLKFVMEPDHCQDVFLALLGDTLVIDSLEDALTYRLQMVRYGPVPTILTRDGFRVNSNGQFGGAQNLVPNSLDDLPKGYFEFVLTKRIRQLEDHVGSLELLHSITVQYETIKRSYDEFYQANNEEMQKYNSELDQILKEKKDCDDRIAEKQKKFEMTNGRHRTLKVVQKRRASDEEELESPPPKKPMNEGGDTPTFVDDDPVTPNGLDSGDEILSEHKLTSWQY